MEFDLEKFLADDDVEASDKAVSLILYPNEAPKDALSKLLAERVQRVRVEEFWSDPCWAEPVPIRNTD